MTTALRYLIATARALANDHPCKTSGHDWQPDGGRPCPRANDPECECSGSQTVYLCARCGTYDYGEPGGPADRECAARRCA